MARNKIRESKPIELSSYTVNALNADALRVFRSLYPNGANHLVCPFVREPYPMRRGGLDIQVVGTPNLADRN